MATLHYRDPTTGQFVPLDGPTGPRGSSGPQGGPGPTVVSGDAGNTAVSGTDGLVFVPGVDTAAMDVVYLNLAGDTMLGELMLPDQVATPPSAATTVAAKGYVDQVITVSDVDPVDLPVRDGQEWFVVEDVVVQSTITLTYETGDVAEFTVSDAYTVDWGDGSAVESFAAGAEATHTYTAAGTAVVKEQVGQTLTSFVLNSTSDAPTGIVFDATTLTHIELESGWYTPSRLENVDFLSPVVLDSCANLFLNQRKLVSVTGSIALSGTDLNNMFESCYVLTTTPLLDSSSGIKFTRMFYECYALPTPPLLDTSSGTSFDNMFSSCSALTTVPLLDTGSGTNFSAMFSGCSALTTVPLLDTSSGTDFGTMFSGCSALTTVPALDTSSGTDFGSMFNDCSALTTVPALNTSSGTSFAHMFSSCSTLTTVPLLDTSSGTSFANMFADCSVLTTVPTLDTSNGTNFSSMFGSCSALTAVPALNTSSGTTFSYMFTDCSVLTAVLIFGERYSISVQATLMDAAAINMFFTNLGTAADAAQTVDVTGAPGAATCDRTIATAKGWTVTP